MLKVDFPTFLIFPSTSLFFCFIVDYISIPPVLGDMFG